MRNLFFGLIAIIYICFTIVSAQQMGDPEYQPDIKTPEYAFEKGPVVGIDQAHHNFHTISGRYEPFSKLLKADGYRVMASDALFSGESLSELNILVISNALNERNIEDWSLPTPSAFARQEIDVVVRWVEEGGALLLIADHMPMPGAAADLAAGFGFTFINGFAISSAKQGPSRFSRATGSLKAHPITDGRKLSERIEHVLSFTGQAFDIPAAASPLMVFGDDHIILMPEVAWQFSDETRRRPAEGLCQGAVLKFGKGRLAVFGEAAMFTSQTQGPGRRFGMTAPGAEQNGRFLLNIIHWLDGDE
jgi:hypothetical protein